MLSCVYVSTNSHLEEGETTQPNVFAHVKEFGFDTDLYQDTQ